MWIRPEDLMRPCDAEVREKQPALKCEIIELQPEKILKEYQKWFTEKATYEYWKSSFAYPWTRLGYTYDWGPGSEQKSHRGLNEFIVKPGSTVILYKAALTNEYPQVPTPPSDTVAAG